MKPAEIPRWLLTLLSVPLSFCFAFFVAVYADGFAASFCPPEKVISSLCITVWYHQLGNVIIVAGASLAAFLIVLLPGLLAPRRKFYIAMTFYVLGVALVLVTLASGLIYDYDPLILSVTVSTLGTGASALFLVKRLVVTEYLAIGKKEADPKVS